MLFHLHSCTSCVDVCAFIVNVGSHELIVVNFVRSEAWMKLLCLLLLAGPLTCSAHAHAQLQRATAPTQLGRLIRQSAFAQTSVPLLNLTTVATGFVADTLCQGKHGA